MRRSHNNTPTIPTSTAIADNDNINNPIFIFGPARSGTTLLQRLLKSFEGVYVMGEHHGAMEPLITSYKCMLKSNKNKTPINEFDNPAFNPCWERLNNNDEIQQSYVKFITALFNPHNQPFRWGFKEIAERYPNKDTYIDLLELFPQAKMLFIYRNIEDVISSRVRMFRQGIEFDKELEYTVRNNINNYINMIHQLNELFPNNTLVLEYNKFIEYRAEYIEKISQFISIPYSERAFTVMETPVN